MAELKLTPSQQLAAFAKDFKLEDAPLDVVTRVKELFADAVGLCYASADMDFTQPVYNVVKSMGGKEESTIIGKTGKYPAAWAALVNGVSIHGLDYDDTHSGSVTHTSPTIVPVVLAIGEQINASGKEILEAAVVGFEVACRVGLSAHGLFQRRGFHTTPMAGIMGSVIAAGKLLGLSQDEMVNAQGVAGSSGSGLREAYLSGGSWTKMYHPGWAAHGAVMAALVAKEGFTGTKTVYEGRFGIFKSHLHPKDADYEALLNELGQRWEIRNICFKPYPTGVINHSYIESALLLSDKYQFNTEEIKKVVCYIHPDAAQTVCEPVATKIRPETGYHGKFSLQYSVAAALVDKEVTIDTYSEEKIKDPSILDMTEKVVYAIDENSTYPNTYPSWLEIHLIDGRILEDKQPFNKGSIEHPMSNEEVLNKYTSNAKHSLSKEQASKVLEKIMKLEKISVISKFTDYIKVEKRDDVYS